MENLTRNYPPVQVILPPGAYESTFQAMMRFPEVHFTKALIEALSAELVDTDITYFVAEIEGQSVGFAKLKRNSREEGVTGDNPIQLCRLYNLQEFIGKGVGRALLLKCFEFAVENSHDTIWLGVWKGNTGAINFYHKFGFEKCGENTFQLSDDPQADWLMQLMQRNVNDFNEQNNL